MTITRTWTCDYCGGEITSKYYAKLAVTGCAIHCDTDEDVTLDDAHHYHTGSSSSCFRKAYDALLLAEEWGPTLETIPTISGQAVAARRRKHNQEDKGA